MKSILLFALSALTWASVFAQSTDCTACNESLHIIQNTIIKTSKVTNDEAMAIMFQYDYTYWQTYKTRKEQSAEGDAGYAMFSASFDTSSSSSQEEGKYQAMKGNYNLNHHLSNSEYQYLFQNTTDPRNLNIWLQCMVNTCGEGPFIEKTIATDVDFTVNLGWRIKNANSANQQARITVVAQNCTMTAGDLKSGLSFSPRLSRIGGFQKINKSQPATVSVTVTGYANPYTVSIPAGNPVRLATPKPIVVDNSVPPGTVVAYAGTDVPTGWLLCDGRALNASQYSALYKALGYTWGTGGGRAGDFSLPDLRGVFLRGVDGGRGRDPEPNRKVGSPQADAFQNHTHHSYKFNGNGSGNRPVGENGGSNGEGGVDWSGQMVGRVSDDRSYRVADETRPYNYAVYYIVKY